MSSYFDEASLVMIPSGYKTSKLYSVKPTDGSGDLVVSRSNDTATRVNSAGLIEKVRTNLLAHSEEFTTANGWSAAVTGGSTATQTSNYGTAPNGTTTADRIQLALNGQAYADWVRPTSGFVVGQSYTYSIYLKSLTGSTTIEFMNDGSGGVLKTITTEWVRYSHSFTAGSSTIYPRFLLQAGTSSTADLLAWGYQLETGDIATNYIATTSAAVSVGPVANVPRLDYLNSSCPRLLLEPQRTNSVYPSEDFSTTWNLYNSATILTNQTTSPDGYVNADKLTTINSANALYNVNGAGSAAGAYTVSLFVKPINNNALGLGMTNDTTGEAFVLINVVTGVGTTTAQTGWSSPTYSVVSYANGWYRVSLTATKDASGNARFILKGNASSEYYIWGAQAEAGAYATSYIPTLGAAVTRGIDRAVKSSISSLIGQSAGTLYGEFTLDSSETINRVFSITGADWNTDGSIRLDIISNKPEIYARKAGADIGSQGSINYTISKGQTIKWALVYTASTMKLFIDGAQRGTTTSLSTTPPACSELFVNELGGGFSNASQNNQRTLWSQVLLFTSALSDADAAALTA